MRAACCVSDSATAFVSGSASLAFAEMRKGLPPAAIMACMNRYGLPKAGFPLVLFGDDFSPAPALAAGLVTQVCEPSELSADVGRTIGEASSQLGPVISARSRDRILAMLDRAVTGGAKVLAGGVAAPGEGFYLKATALYDVKPEDEMGQEEVFGPVTVNISGKTVDWYGNDGQPKRLN